MGPGKQVQGGRSRVGSGWVQGSGSSGGSRVTGPGWVQGGRSRCMVGATDVSEEGSLGESAGKAWVQGRIQWWTHR